TREEWLEQMVNESREIEPDLPSYQEWKEMGIYRKDKGPAVALADFRDDPEANPLPTPSGKIEIYSDRLAAMAEKWEFGVFRPELEGDKLTALPEFVETWEGAIEARESDKFPLQVIGHHYK